MNTCADCGRPVNRGATSAHGTTARRCLICDIARNPPPPPPHVLRQRVRDALKRRAKGARRTANALLFGSGG